MPARTGDAALFGGRFGELEQAAESGRPGLMQSGAEGHFYRFQIHATGLVPLREDAAQQRGYFARDFALDRFGHFFSCAVSVSSTGRARQIFSLTSTKERSNSRYRRNVSTSRSALRCAAGEAKLSVTVFPSSL